MKAPAYRFERVSQRAKRVPKPQRASLEPASDVSDPIDEEISSLLESISSQHEAQAGEMDRDFRPDIAPDRLAPRQAPPATRLRKSPDPVREPKVPRRVTVPRPARPSQTVRQALSGIAIDLPYLLPRPHLSYGLRHGLGQVFSLIAIMLVSAALAFLIVFLVSP
jgi:hypothetical protein